MRSLLCTYNEEEVQDVSRLEKTSTCVTTASSSTNLMIEGPVIMGDVIRRRSSVSTLQNTMSNDGKPKSRKPLWISRRKLVDKKNRNKLMKAHSESFISSSSPNMMPESPVIMGNFIRNNEQNGAIVDRSSTFSLQNTMSNDGKPKSRKPLWISRRRISNKRNRNNLMRALSESLIVQSDRNILTAETGAAGRFRQSRDFDVDTDRTLRQSMGLRDILLKSMHSSSLSLVPLNTISAEASNENKSNMVQRKRQNDWLSSFRRLDPRYQILEFFNDVAREGVDRIEEFGFRIKTRANSPRILDFFHKAAAFSVWRPTSNDAIQKMITGEGTGKGLDVKGKSAKKGILSGFIPFLQIYEEEHKSMVRWPPSDGIIRIYYKSESARNKAATELTSISNEMEATVSEAKAIISKNCLDKVECNKALEKLIFDVVDSKVHELNNYSHNLDNPSQSRFGIAVAERIFFKTYITRQDISRSPDNDIGRPSEPAFQDMNFACTCKYKGIGPCAVVLQLSDNADNELCPQNLVVAYEENGKVTPVTSDFDCFLVGTRNINYETPLSVEQVNLLKWLLAQVEKILDSPITSRSWTSRWLDVLKDSADKGFYPVTPEFGFGDPKSYAIMEDAVGRLSKNGSVRHGAECFNYFYPQELDHSFLVISDNVGGKVPWKYVDVQELQELLCDRIEQGFTFPLNPKWILANRGWKAVYDKMMSSDSETIQKSLAVWYPPESGIRELIEDVCIRFPDGFQRLNTVDGDEVIKNEGTEAMDLAAQQLQRHLILRRAKFKLRLG